MAFASDKHRGQLNGPRNENKAYGKTLKGMGVGVTASQEQRKPKTMNLVSRKLHGMNCEEQVR